MRLLSQKGAVLSYNDPFVPSMRLNGEVLRSEELSPEAIGNQDCLIILTDHSAYDFRAIIASAKLVIDTRNATKGFDEFRDRIIKLGAGNKTVLAGHEEDEHEMVGVAQLRH
jgi:UDP-N-acetyl-D-glucosamine dehydrogenase